MLEPSNDGHTGLSCVAILIRASDLVNYLSIAGAVVCLAASLGIAAWGVVARYLLNNSLIWNEEAATYLFIWLTFLGAGIVYKEGGHPSLQFLLVRFSPFSRRILLLLGDLVVMAMGMVLAFFGARLLPIVAIRSAASIPMSMAIPYLAPVLGGAVLILHALVQIRDDMVKPLAGGAREDQ
jgi:TRAP-type C4-dicarboxylate transport system permease small subunit